jgi:hypothetical protein
VSARFFPADQYREALHYAITVARSLDGRFEIGIEKFTEYGKSGFRAGFLLPRPENRFGFELRCEVVRAADPLPAIR